MPVFAAAAAAAACAAAAPPRGPAAVVELSTSLAASLRLAATFHPPVSAPRGAAPAAHTPLAAHSPRPTPPPTAPTPPALTGGAWLVSLVHCQCR